MGLFGIKKNSLEFDAINNCVDSLKDLLRKDRFISRKDYIKFIDDNKKIFDDFKLMEEKNVLRDWCKRNGVNLRELTNLMKAFSSIEKDVEKHNENFITRHLTFDKDYLDKILIDDDPNIILDEEQRRVVLSDEDYTLVVAGAGAGKTTTIEAKVKYLVEKKNIDPGKILIVSFTKKATDELKERFKRLKLKVVIATFHSIGNTIIKESEDIHHKIVDDGFMFNSIKQYLMMKLDDEYFIKKILLFFASYLNMPFQEEETALLFKTLSQDNCTTLKGDLKNALDRYQKTQTKARETLNDERVRSADECRIANFLFINGIEYEYEPVYRYGFSDTTKPYCPDFLIKQNGQEIYLEHFGISEDGSNNRFTEDELKEYKKHINDKINLHKSHNTRLIYTFSHYRDGKDLITHLKEVLSKAGVVLNPKSEIEIYRQIAKNAEDKYFNKFIQLVVTFLKRFKVNNFTPSKFDEWKMSLNDERSKLFIDICYQCYLAYTRALKDENAIDFEDMINNAANILDNKIRSGEKYPFDYILVDEYQDISLQRFDLCEKLSKVSDAKIIAVGDDWQSIFRFSGAKIDLFTKFEDKMGYAKTLKITKTYRNSQELIDIAGGFVMENKSQIQKQLRSNKRIKDPVLLMSYDDSYNKANDDKTPYVRMGEAIEKSLDDIVLKCGINKTVLLIGRYGFEGRNLARLTDLFTVGSNGNIISKKYPTLNISFMTAHSSKGLGYDNVIIINGKDDILGFPSKIEDDPLMKLVIKEDEADIEFAEERRLFYVALTRTKNRVYIITPQTKPSKFILEIKDHFDNVQLRGVELNPIEQKTNKFTCPICGYPLQRRASRDKRIAKLGTKLWVCSNDPEVCGFMTNNLSGGRMSISKCPKCEDGFLIVKMSKEGMPVLGCTNYKSDLTGCNVIMNMDNYTQNRSELISRYADSIINIDDSILMGYPIKELVYSILAAIKDIYAKKPNIHLNVNSLALFLTGGINNMITKFGLANCYNYGMLDQKLFKKLLVLIRILIKDHILSVDSENYGSISIVNENPTDDVLLYVLSEVV